MQTKKFLALLPLICFFSNAKAFADVPHSLPELTLPMLDGVHQLKLNGHIGKVIYLDIWASSCAACTLALPDLETMHSEIASDDFEVLSITVDRTSSDANRFLQKLHLNIPSALDADSKTLALLSVTGLPAGFLVDATGKIRLIHQGYRPRQSEFLKAYIDKLLQEHAVALDDARKTKNRN